MAKNARGNDIKIKNRVWVVALASVLATPVFAFDLDNGRSLYGRHCADCHGTDGRGVHPMAPNFRNLEGLMVSDRRLENHIRMGKGGCPSFAGIIKDAHLFDVVTYLRVFR